LHDLVFIGLLFSSSGIAGEISSLNSERHCHDFEKKRLVLAVCNVQKAMKVSVACSIVISLSQDHVDASYGTLPSALLW
jgi:hypothetical protein